MVNTDSKQDIVFKIFCYVIILLIAIVTFYPFWDIAMLSISERGEALKGGFRFITKNPTLQAYRDVLISPEIWNGFKNSLYRVLLGTTLSVFFTTLTAYPLSKKGMPFNRLITMLILFTMIFNGGLIPTYLLYKNLGLLNKIWALVLPQAVTAFNLIIMRNFLTTIPDSLEESAKIDGASYFKVWYKIIVPLSKPAIATITLWISVSHWNQYFDAMIYMHKRALYTLPVILRRILIENELDRYMPGAMENVTVRLTPESTKAAIMMISIVPIVCVYPFIQKYFTKGIMLGAVKG